MIINDLTETVWWCKGGVPVQLFIPAHHFLIGLNGARALTLAPKPQLHKIKLF